MQPERHGTVVQFVLRAGNDLLICFQGVGICGQNPFDSTRLEYREDLGKVKTFIALVHIQ